MRPTEEIRGWTTSAIEVRGLCAEGTNEWESICPTDAVWNLTLATGLAATNCPIPVPAGFPGQECATWLVSVRQVFENIANQVLSGEASFW